MNIWQVLWYHNRRRWRANLANLYTQIISLTLLFFMSQMFFGVTHFFTVVETAIAQAKVIHFTANGNYLIVPDDGSSWTLWQPGSQMIITDTAKGVIGTASFFVTRILGFVAVGFGFKSVWDARQHSRLELEAREYKYRVWYYRSLDAAFVIRIATVEKLLLSLLAICVSVPLSMFGLVPAAVFTLNQGLPGIGSFFSLTLPEAVMLIVPLFLLVLLGCLFTRRGAKALIQELLRR